MANLLQGRSRVQFGEIGRTKVGAGSKLGGAEGAAMLLGVVKARPQSLSHAPDDRIPAGTEGRDVPTADSLVGRGAAVGDRREWHCPRIAATRSCSPIESPTRAEVMSASNACTRPCDHPVIGLRSI